MLRWAGRASEGVVLGEYCYVEERSTCFTSAWLRRGLLGLGCRAVQRLVGSECGYAFDARFRCVQLALAGKTANGRNVSQSLPCVCTGACSRRVIWLSDYRGNKVVIGDLDVGRKGLWARIVKAGVPRGILRTDLSLAQG